MIYLDSMIKDEEAMIKMGFNMLSDDEQEEKNEEYSHVGFSNYTLKMANNEGYFLGDEEIN